MVSFFSGIICKFADSTKYDALQLDRPGEPGGESWRSMLDVVPNVARRVVRSDATRCK